MIVIIESSITYYVISKKRVYTTSWPTLLLLVKRRRIGYRSRRRRKSVGEVLGTEAVDVVVVPLRLQKMEEKPLARNIDSCLLPYGTKVYLFT